MKYFKTINLIFISIVIFAMPAFALAQTDSIFVKLQIPLPFIPVGGTTKVLQPDGSYKDVKCIVKEQRVIDGVSKEVDVPAVCDLSDYIRGVYRLLIGAGALFAVVMLVIAGYQWIFSGGSADKTGAAKKRILGAVIGLMLALLSYTILNAITPRLVALRLPYVEPVVGLEFTPNETCWTNKELIKYEKDLGLKEGKLPIWYSAEVIGEVRRVDELRERAYCGKMYNVDGADGKVFAQCAGGYCDDNQACVFNRCLDAVIVGTVSWPMFQNTYVDKISVMAVCEGVEVVSPLGGRGGKIQYKSIGKLSIFRIPWRRGIYKDASIATDADKIDYREEGEKLCTGDKVLKGFVLKVEVNDDKGAWHNIFPTIDNDFALGKKPGTRECMSAPMKKDVPNEDPKVDWDDVDFSKYDKTYFFQPEDLPILQCDIDIAGW